MNNFFAELKRRHVYRVAVAYAAVGWLLIQVATQVLPFLEIPTWVVQMLIAMVLIGFPIALLIAWTFELTSAGIKRTTASDLPAKESAENHGWIYVAVIGATLAAALFFLGRYTAPRTRDRISPGVAAKSIAVLPFDNLSRDRDDVYFAEGIQNEILTKLAAVGDLKVISRTSTTKYQSQPNNLKTVAQELGVANILEGAVQRAGNKIRVNVQLIDARSDTHIWAKSYDRDLKDVLSVESEVAGEIVDSLKANLSPGEARLLAAASTQDTEAHDLFLRGEYERHQAQSTLTAEALDRADAFYQQALAKDPDFVAAAAGLATARLYRHWFVTPLEPRELDEIKSVIDRALAKSPYSSEAHYALGLFYYWGYRQYEKALAEFKRTLELQPNNASARQFCGWVYRRQGEWDRSLKDVRLAEELDPRDPAIPASLGGSYLCLRLWSDAERSELRALKLDPHKAEAALILAITRINSTGNIEFARQTFSGFPDDIRSSTLIFQGDSTAIVGIRVYLYLLERRFDEAIDAFNKEIESGEPRYLQQLSGRAVLYLLQGNLAAADSNAGLVLSRLETRCKERPDDTFAMTQLSWVYLALGRKADALRVARQAADSISIEKDALSGTFFQSGLAQIEANAGAEVDAVKRLRYLLSIPAGQPVSVARLKIDPVWDPLRGRADFQELLSSPEQIGPKNKAQ
jgi:TolB-like protein/Flp pilus assembly protein TadD